MSKKEKKRHFTLEEDAGVKGVKIRFNITEYSNGSYRISGYLIEAKSGIPLDHQPTLVRNAQSPQELPTKKNHLARALLDKLPPVEAAKHTPQKEKPVGLYAEAFQELESTLKDDPSLSETMFPSWGKNTLLRHLSYFRNRILPRLAKLEEAGALLDEVELEALRVALTEKTFENGNSRKVVKSIHTTVHNELAAGELIYQKMQLFRPDLPDIHLHDGRRVFQFQPEHAKSLPAPIRYRLIQLLMDRIPHEPNFVFHALLMLVAGLRDSEACAVTVSSLQLFSDYGTVFVRAQIDKDKETITEYLKTSNAYRLVILSFWAVRKLQECISLCQQQNTEIQPYMQVNTFSSKIKHLLLKAGCEEGFFRAAQALMDAYPDKVGDEICLDINSYILRRDFASRAKNICGLTNDEIDALLGHARGKAARERVNYANIDCQIKTAKKLERFVYDPNLSLNPEFQAIPLVANHDFELLPYNAYSFQNTSDQSLWVELDLLAAEPDESITLTIPQTDTANVQRVSRSFSPATRDIIGNSYALRNYKRRAENEPDERCVE